MVQWLRLHVTNARGESSIPGQGTKIPHVARCSQKKEAKYNHSTLLSIVWILFVFLLECEKWLMTE